MLASCDISGVDFVVYVSVVLLYFVNKSVYRNFIVTAILIK